MWLNFPRGFLVFEKSYGIFLSAQCFKITQKVHFIIVRAIEDFLRFLVVFKHRD